MMSWPVVRGWTCQTCGTDANGLIWGILHARCRCRVCHTQYHMRDASDEVTDTPICCLKDEYKGPARVGYAKYRKPLSEWTDGEWNLVMTEKVEAQE